MRCNELAAKMTNDQVLVINLFLLLPPSNRYESSCVGEAIAQEAWNTVACSIDHKLKYYEYIYMGRGLCKAALGKP